MTPDQIKSLQTQLNLQGAGLKVDGILGPQTTAAMNKAISSAVASNPNLSHLTSQNQSDAITNAYMTGDWSGVVDNTGKPFSAEDQQNAVAKANAALAPQFQEQQNYDQNTTAQNLADTSRGLSQYLDTSKTNFVADKNDLDQNAANNGILFSGSRIQKQNNLKNQYDKADAAKVAEAGSNIATTAGNYAYKYGTNAAQSPTLSQYYQTPSNVYNPGAARNNVSSGSISSAYNPAGTNYQGTAVNANRAAVQTRAASLLANKANKILPSGYQTQL